MGKEKISSFSPLKVKIYKEEKEDPISENKIKISATCKFFFEDFKKHNKFISKIEPDTIASNADFIRLEQIESSDLVNSE